MFSNFVNLLTVRLNKELIIQVFKMKKIVLLLLALSFFSLNAQTKKKTTKGKKAKTTKVAKKSAKEKPVAETPVDTADNTPVSPPVSTVVDEPITSTSILNASSPASFRKYRDMNVIKRGDSMVSTKIVPVEYGSIEDKDVLRSMVVWEIIDMNDKINQPFYQNNDGLVSQNKSLYQVLFDNVMDGKIKEVYEDELFTTRIEPDQIKSKLAYTTISNAGIDKMNEQGGSLTPEQIKEYTDVFEVKTENVKLIKIKGMWYIDRRDGQMRYRLLGIAAMGQDPTTMGQVGPDGKSLANKDELIDLFWVWYPDARKVLVNSIVFNGENRSSDVSFDDLLNARRFSSVIYKADNAMGQGVIKDYLPRDAEAQLEESDRIKDQILQMENDMWNY